MGYEPSFGIRESFESIDLIAGEYPLKTETILLEKGQVLKRGAVLGRITATGKCVLSAKTGQGTTAIEDGSELPILVLAEDVDASEKDKPTAAYKTGWFVGDALSFGKGHSLATAKPLLEQQKFLIEG